MAQRAYEFIVGPETSTLPTASDPVDPEDMVSKGYADETYAQLSSWATSVADITAVKAIAPADRADRQVIAIDGQVLYQFDANSTATPDDDLVLQPNTGSGRYLKIETGGGGGGAGITVEMLEQQADLAHAGTPITPIDAQVLDSFSEPELDAEVFLMRATSGTTLWLAPNPKFWRSADKNSDFTGGEFSAVTGTDAANIDTETTTKLIGSSAVSFDKAAGTSVNSFIQDDLGSGNGISLAGHGLFLMAVNMPSVTNLSTISIRISSEGDDPTNYSTFSQSVQADNSAFVVGWNIVAFNLRGTKSDTGTGWSITQLARTLAVGVVTSSASQTYTNIVVDSKVFVEDTGDAVVPSYKQILQPGMRLVISDTSNREYFTIAHTSPRVYGPVTIAGALGSTYAGGTASVAMRSQLGSSGDGRSTFTSTTRLIGASLSSGASNLTQNRCASRMLNETLINATFDASVGLSTELVFNVIDTPTSTTISVDAPVDYSAQLTSGKKLHIFEMYTVQGRRQYRYTGTDITLTANSSWSAGVLTLTASTGNVTSVDSAIAVGGFATLVKAEDVSLGFSLVSATAAESFSAVTVEEINLLDVGLPYPKASSIFGHYLKLTPTQNTATWAAKKRFGSGPDLTVVGTGADNFERTFKNGQLGAGAFSDTNYFTVGTLLADSSALNPDSGAAGAVSVSFWAYPITASPAAYDTIVSRDDTVNGYLIYIATDRTLHLVYVGGSGEVATSAVMAINAWHHCVVVMQDGGSSAIYVDGVKTSASGNIITSSSSSALGIGRRVSVGGLSSNDTYITDLVFWSGVALSDADVAALYAGGRHRILGVSPGPVYRGSVAGVGGQKLSIDGSLARTTNAVEPFITHVGAIKTG